MSFKHIAAPKLPSWLFVALSSLLVLGCSTTSKKRPSNLADKDSRLVRYVDSGREAFAEGEIDDALKEYRRAILRAWAIDDPYESGTAAYHLAVCLVSRERYCEASDWLVDARAELGRAHVSTGNTWLLSAEIAMAQEQFEDANLFLNYASAACPPCEAEVEVARSGSHRLIAKDNCDQEGCRSPCWSRLPWLGKKWENKKELQDCQTSFQANIELARARLTAKQADLCAAKKHYHCGASLAEDACNLSLQADRHEAAAVIFDLEGNFMQAGMHRDREVELLRSIAEYRELPTILDAAAHSYCQAERLDLAVERLIRSARILLARGELDASWNHIRIAGEFVQATECDANRIRLALLAKWVEESLAAKANTGANEGAATSPEEPKRD